MNTTPLLSEYFEHQTSSEEKYGMNTVIFMQVGSFYEIYEVEGQCGKAKECGNILNIAITRKDKSKPHSVRNPYMIGFPIYVLDKFVNKMIEHNYTIVRIDQREYNKIISRDIVEVYSPSTYLENNIQTTNYLMGINIEKCAGNEYIHICAVDMTTGKVILRDIHGSNIQNQFNRILNSINPVEIVLNKIAFLDIYNIQIPTIEIPLKHDYSKLVYQEQFLSKVYSKSIEQLDLTMYADLVTVLIYTLQFAYEHSHAVISKLHKPVILNDENTLVLNNDSMYQLHLITRENKSLYDIVNNTCTNMGKRLLREYIVYPSTSPNTLQKRYNKVGKYIEHDRYVEYQSVLKTIADIEKIHRKIELEKCTPHIFYTLTQSYEGVSKLLNILDTTLVSNLDTLNTHFHAFHNEIKRVLNIPNMENINTEQDVKSSFFNFGIFQTVDNIEQSIQDIRVELGKYETELMCKLQYTQKDGYYLSTTPSRAKQLDKNAYNLIPNKTFTRVGNKDIDNLTEKLNQYETELQPLVFQKFQIFLNKLYTKFKSTTLNLVKCVSEVDIFCSYAKSSIQLGYTKPVLKNKYNGTSFISIKGMRHPIIERLLNTEFERNDIEINGNGMLIYGINGGGKSTILRAIGCNIVLAQIGMYVPCDSMTFYPYTRLISKISITDNIYKGYSTFISEMLELKSMLTYADKNTIVLADELCAGSESLSATSIVASSVLHLIKTKCSFVFTTHLHSLVELDCIQSVKNLQVKHLQVQINPDKSIKYNRVLQDGHGSSLYGLEIAESMGVNDMFIQNAYQIRTQLENLNSELVSTKKSKYNSNVYVDTCSRCGKTSKQTGEPLHTHHKHHQVQADRNGMIDSRFHKNTTYNLEVLCRKCHENEHNTVEIKKKYNICMYYIFL